MISTVGLGMRAFQNKSAVAPLSPRPVAAAQAAIVLDKSPSVPVSEPAPIKGIVPLTHSMNVLEIVAAPTKNELLVVTAARKDSSGEEYDAYGGVLYFVHPNSAKSEAQEIVAGNNIVSGSSPVWSPDGTVAYHVYDNGTCAPIGTGICGIFTLDPGTGETRKLLPDSTQGLAISPGGALLAFWDYTTGDKLTILDLKTKTIVQAWAGQVHTADDSVLSDIAFAPDEKSVLALTYAGSEIPLKQFDLQTGKVRTVCHHAQSLVAAADGVYFLQFEPVSAMPESPRALMKISSSASEPEKVLDNFPYYALSTSGNRRWIVAQGKEKGIAIYDTRDQTTRVAGKNCQAAAVMSDSKVIYAVLGDLNADPAACGPGKPAQPGVR
jgi:hypothetical protein